MTYGRGGGGNNAIKGRRYEKQGDRVRGVKVLTFGPKTYSSDYIKGNTSFSRLFLIIIFIKECFQIIP